MHVMAWMGDHAVLSAVFPTVSSAPCWCAPCTATQSFWIVGGQHSFVATQRIKEDKVHRGHPVPRWCVLFRCTVVKADTSVSDVQTVAGQAQAQSGNVQQMKMAATLNFYWGLVQEFREQNPGKDVIRTELLTATYGRTGKNVTMDNTPVCALPVVHLLCLWWLTVLGSVVACVMSPFLL